MPAGTYCDRYGEDGGVYPHYIEEGVGYLNGIPDCRCRARSCVRVSCSYNSAIWLCNDNYNDIDIDCWSVAWVTMGILSQCTYEDRLISSDNYVHGQSFTTDNWNVIVRYDDWC